jgi:hypothetical protein
MCLTLLHDNVLTSCIGITTETEEQLGGAGYLRVLTGIVIFRVIDKRFGSVIHAVILRATLVSPEVHGQKATCR